MVERKLSAKVTRAVFFRNFNDVDVFIEDASKETRKLIATLLTRASGMRTSIESVFPLGSKCNVVQACFQDQDRGGRPRVYVVDGDLDRSSASLLKVKRLFVLSKYCIENYLFDELAIGHVIAEHSAVMDEVQAIAAFDFQGWLARNADILHELYLIYATSRIIAPHLKNSSFPLSRMLSDASGDVDADKVTARIGEVRAQLMNACGSDELLRWEAFVRERLKGSSLESKLSQVSGKDVLVPLARLRMHSIEKIGVPEGVLKIRLASHSNPVELNEIFAVATA